MSGVDEISQLSGKPVACVPCSMTPVESASRPMLPSAFPDGVGLHHFLYGAQSHGPQRSLSTLRPWGRPQLRKTRFQLYLRPWLGGIGYPQGFNSRFQLMASSSARLGWRTREIGSRASRASRASPDFGFRAAACQIEFALLSSEEIFFVSVLRTKKCVLALAVLPISRTPCKISIARRGLHPLRRLLRFGLRFGSPR